MEENNILITNLPLLWYLDNFLLDQLEKYRVTPIIHSGKLELIVDVIGGVLPDMFQALSISDPRMISMPLLTWPRWHVLFIIPW